MELIIGLIALVIIVAIIFYGSLFFIIGMGYAYWALSIGMAPVLWLLTIIGALVGFICSVKNAIKAVKAMRGV